MIVPIWNGKGRIHDPLPWRYRGITLLSEALKLQERILNIRVRDIVEKMRTLINDMAFGFVDLEQAFDTASR